MRWTLPRALLAGAVVSLTLVGLMTLVYWLLSLFNEWISLIVVATLLGALIGGLVYVADRENRADRRHWDELTRDEA